MYREYIQKVEALLREITGEEDVLLTDGGDHADIASTVAFALAKKERKNPAAIASEIVAKVSARPDAAGIAVSAKGPYINFVFGGEYVADSVRAARGADYGQLPARTERVILEHTSANPNGPLHVGHIRNTVIGDTLVRAFRKAGYSVEAQYYLNDMGRQIAIVAWGVKNLHYDRLPNEKGDEFIVRHYVEANKIAKEKPEIEPEFDVMMEKIEAGDPETVKLFHDSVDICAEGIKETLAAMNVHHDRFVRETTFLWNGEMQKVMARIEKLPEANHEDQMMYLDLSDKGFGNKYVLRRSNGTSVYAARDLAFHLWKNGQCDRSIDVLGADHKLIGAQLQATLSLIGERPPEIVHFEFVSLPEGSMTTRGGVFITADELIAETKKRALEEVTVRRPELSESERQQIASAVAIGAVRYDIVKVSAEKSTVFDWKEALDFERQSAPYVQYAHARACSILEKAKAEGGFAENYSYADPYEIALAKHIAHFPYVIEKVVMELRPHLLATYVRDLADLFNSFYRFAPVLKAEGSVRDARLTLVDASRNTLASALDVLGIEALKSM
ncbi:arginine--tRNA ligase [Methanorbis rubei]|uniref:Arginine--tRNA ligase n=1 Tax=Methanorbis rubei TaxID=3028300 RepID=A0AAE4SDM4_9EURY|nr:Arginine--tRNA ligase [Methanocorpusculaceae archaeon Cs1]